MCQENVLIVRVPCSYFEEFIPQSDLPLSPFFSWGSAEGGRRVPESNEHGWWRARHDVSPARLHFPVHIHSTGPPGNLLLRMGQARGWRGLGHRSRHPTPPARPRFVMAQQQGQDWVPSDLLPMLRLSPTAQSWSRVWAPDSTTRARVQCEGLRSSSIPLHMDEPRAQGSCGGGWEPCPSRPITSGPIPPLADMSKVSGTGWIGREDICKWWGGSEWMSLGHRTVNSSLSPGTQARSRTAHPDLWPERWG